MPIKLPKLLNKYEVDSDLGYPLLIDANEIDLDSDSESESDSDLDLQQKSPYTFQIAVDTEFTPKEPVSIQVHLQIFNKGCVETQSSFIIINQKYQKYLDLDKYIDGDIISNVYYSDLNDEETTEDI
jgi:hypothetical protein